MTNKILLQYVISSVIACFIFYIIIIVSNNYNELFQVVFEGTKDYLNFILFWLLQGLTIGSALLFLGKMSTNLMLQFVICVLTSLFITYFYRPAIESAYEGVLVWVVFLGIIAGGLIFLVNRLMSIWW
ncbi:hypothetical protein PDL71_01800 [Lacibacter sp. MH-610]|uniref:hypothetical protein n=1 Tax=Lacibacter sp. MH-610 TaxID=3020883 RepID=UPI003892BD8C